MLNYDKPSRIFPCILLTRNHMIFLVQFGINNHLLIFSKTTNCTRPKKIYPCLFISNYTRNHVITYTNRTLLNMMCQLILTLIMGTSILKSLKTNQVGEGQGQEVDVEVPLWKDKESKLSHVCYIDETRQSNWVLVFSNLPLHWGNEII